MRRIPKDIGEYLKTFAEELGARVVAQYPPLYRPGEPVRPELSRLRRKPFPAQTLAVMGVCRRLDESRSAAVIAECGTGKTLGSSRQYLRARARETVYRHFHGAAAVGGEDVPGMLIDPARRTRFHHRRASEWRFVEWLYRRQ
jgi:hypothetical protein